MVCCRPAERLLQYSRLRPIFTPQNWPQRGWCCHFQQSQFLNATYLENIPVPDDVEAMWINIRPPRLSWSIANIVAGTVYYPPRSPIAQTLLEHISSAVGSILAHQPDTGIAILGDFDRLDLDAILSNSLVQLVDQPTCDEAKLDKIVNNLAAHYNPVEICSPICSQVRCHETQSPPPSR